MENLRKIILLMCCVIPFMGSTQNAFYKKYTSGPFDHGNGITQLPDSTYAVTGSSGGFDENSGQAFLTLFDTLGNFLWTKSYGGDGDDIGVRVIHVPGDGFFIAGYTGSTALGDFDFVVYKTDESGELIWEKHYGGSNWEKLHDAKLLADGGLILVGQTEGATTEGIDMFLVRTDALGDTIWTKTIQTPEDDIAFAVDTLSSTQFVVGGVMGDAGVENGMIIGFHIDGTQEFLEFYSQNGITKVRDLVVFDNRIYVTGTFYNSVANKQDKWAGRSEINGDYISDWTWGYNGDSECTALAIRDHMTVYFAFSSHAPDLNPFPGVGDDVFVIGYTTSFYFNGMSHGFSANDNDVINEMIVTNDGGFVLVGTVSDDASNSSTGSDIMIARIGPGGEVIEFAETGLDFVGLIKEEKSILGVHPNPTRDVINFPDNVHGMTYHVINFQGQIVMNGEVEPSVSLANLNPGIYIIKVEDQNQVWTSKVIKH